MSGRIDDGSFCPGCLKPTDSLSSDACPACGLSRPVSGWPRDPYVGRVVAGKYRPLRELGEGGFARVYLARQLEGEIDLGEVVLKFLHPSLARKENIRRRFINEARAVRQVRSPHAVKVFDLGFDSDGTPFLVMEYLEGESLQAVLDREGSLAPGRVLGLGLQVAGALQECHERGILHRDLKPDNLLLLPGRAEDFVKVLDFGIARVPDADGSTTDTVMGTPRYMPPEQIRSQPMNATVDIFALGVILYECLAGRAPIAGSTPGSYLELNLTESPTPLRELRADLPADLEVLLGRMMSKDPLSRPGSMTEVERRLLLIGRQQGWLTDHGRGAKAESGGTRRLSRDGCLAAEEAGERRQGVVDHGAALAAAALTDAAPASSGIPGEHGPELPGPGAGPSQGSASRSQVPVTPGPRWRLQRNLPLLLGAALLLAAGVHLLLQPTDEPGEGALHAAQAAESVTDAGPHAGGRGDQGPDEGTPHVAVAPVPAVTVSMDQTQGLPRLDAAGPITTRPHREKTRPEVLLQRRPPATRRQGASGARSSAAQEDVYGKPAGGL